MYGCTMQQQINFVVHSRSLPPFEEFLSLYIGLFTRSPTVLADWLDHSKFGAQIFNVLINVIEHVCVWTKVPTGNL